MKNSIALFVFIILCPTKFSAQDYNDQFKNDICDCLEDKFYKLKRASSAYDKCFQEKLPVYASLIDAEINEENTKVKFSKGQLARRELKKRYQIELMYSCDLYYRAKEEEYRKKMAKGVTEVSFADLKSLNEMVAMYPKAISYMFRAKTHFYLGNLKQAEADIIESYKIDTGRLNSLEEKQRKVLYALILQEQRRYAEAGKLYDEIYETSKDIEAAIYRAMVNRLNGDDPPIKTSSLNNKNSQMKSAKTNGSNNKSNDAKDSDLRKLFKLKKN
ncbi:hypothetical protein [Winogradskyella alexanderae]|uniref:Tetratricopeptide repeat protein n=1 Tax=Winogradskyella alexanderae TaxID=2877123 RepID=A0ABS7XSC0_9FLAO|nr:hypothetical protein [Winogradskyella alexanderae]MCA0131931.1 hypothetical protein [Winogradskyella alexanderae]